MMNFLVRDKQKHMPFLYSDELCFLSSTYTRGTMSTLYSIKANYFAKKKFHNFYRTEKNKCLFWYHMNACIGLYRWLEDIIKKKRYFNIIFLPTKAIVFWIVLNYHWQSKSHTDFNIRKITEHVHDCILIPY